MRSLKYFEIDPLAVDFWRWPRHERSADIRSDLGQASNVGQRQKRRNLPGASLSGIKQCCEFSRIFFDRCFSGQLRRRSAHLEKSDGIAAKHRPAPSTLYFARHAGCLAHDGFVFSSRLDCSNGSI